MNTNNMITEFEVSNAERFFETLDAESSQKFFEDFARVQKHAFIFLMTLSEDIEKDEVKHEVLYLTGVIYQAFTDKYGKLNEVSEDLVDVGQRYVINQLDQLAKPQGTDGVSTKTVFETTSQPFLLAYIMHEVARAHGAYSEKDRLVVFTILQTMAYCFNNVIAVSPLRKVD